MNELPMGCRTCAHRESVAVQGHWTHHCTRRQAMVEGCRWRLARRLTLQEEGAQCKK